MAKLWYTKDIKGLVKAKVERDVLALYNDSMKNETQLAAGLKKIREFEDAVKALIWEMEDLDKKDDEEMAKWRAAQAAKEAGKQNDE